MLDENQMLRWTDASCDEVEDGTLERLAEGVDHAEVRGIDASDDGSSLCPCEVLVAKPQAYDVHRLCSTVDSRLAKSIRAALGPNVPILLCHHMTPFYRPGVAPTGVWGTGYEVTVHDVDASTIAVFPDSGHTDIAEAKQDILVGLSVGGALKVSNDALGPLQEIPGIEIRGARVVASTDQLFRIHLASTWSVLDVQAGPVGSGGARWNIYRTTKRVDLGQTLLQTILIPKGIRELHVSVSTWIRCTRRMFVWNKPIQWTFPKTEFRVSLT